MPKYTANAYLVKDGKVIQPGGELGLTKEQGDRLGDKVTLVEEEAEEKEHTAASLKKLSADEQKAIVTELGGKLEEITNEETRISFILENQ